MNLTPHRPSASTTGSSSRPASVRSYRVVATGGGAASRRTSPLILELSQALAQQVGSDAGQAVLEIGVPAPALEQQLPDDEHRPPVANHVESLGHSAVLVIGPHTSSLSPVGGVSIVVT